VEQKITGLDNDLNFSEGEFSPDKPMPVSNSYIFTSGSYLVLGYITIPRLLMILLTLSFVLIFHLDQPYKHYPLHQFLIVLNSFYFLLGIIPVFSIKIEWINNLILLGLTGLTCVSLQFMTYSVRKKLGFWSNLMIFAEIFLETMDGFNSKLFAFGLILVVFFALVLIGWLVIKLLNFKKFIENESIIRKHKIKLFLEVLVTSMLALKMVAFSTRLSEPFRIPIYIYKMFFLPAFYKPTKKVSMIVQSAVFVLIFYSVRMSIVIWR